MLLGGVQMKVKSFTVTFAALVLTTGLLFLVGHTSVLLQKKFMFISTDKKQEAFPYSFLNRRFSC
jgi:hypothetical protein